MTKKLFFFSLLALLGIAMHAQEVGESNLLNITNYPYLQVPVSQVLPAGKVKNTGTTTLTNLILTAKIDGNIVGTSAFLADLEPGETAELPLSPAVNFPEGENVITYTITQDGICEISEKNLYTFTVMGTPNLFAIDNATATSASISNTSSNTYFGNIFEVTSTTAISQVIIGFATNYNVNFNIALYEMTGDLTVSSTPLFSQTASKNATGFLFYTVPTTVMTPGRYFLCVHQTNNTSLGVMHDGNNSRSVYRMTGANQTLTNFVAVYGAAAIRMVTEVDECVAPSNLAVTPKHINALLSWEGNAIRYQLTLNNGTTDISYIATTNSFNATGLTLATDYTWKVVALCDGTHSATTEGTPFSTLACQTIAQYPFTENFDETGTALPGCWTNTLIKGTTNWTVVPEITGIPNTVHSGTHKIRFSSLTKGNSARLTMPPLDLTGLSSPMLSFWHTQDFSNPNQDTLKVYYKTSASGEWIHLVTYDKTIANWQKDTIFLPEPSNDYYISFVAISQSGRGVQLDDVQIGNADDSTDGGDLANLTRYPYSQVPVSQTIPPAIVKNTGFNTQTNVVLTAEINGEVVGTSEALDALEVGETVALELTPAVFVPAGNNNMTYKITQNQTDDNPEDNIVSFSFKGTQNIFAVDGVVTCENGAGSGANTYTIGQMFTITQTSTLSQVVVGHGAPTHLEYSVSLYAMEDDLLTAATPLFSQNAVRKATGFNIITVPATTLTPGNYYLCVNQLTSTNISIAYDNNLTKKSYIRNENGNLSEPPIKVGAVAIRMVLEVSDCIADQPENLTVTPSYTSAVFSWEGTTPLYFLMTLNDGNQDYTFETKGNSITVDEFPMGTSYTWKVSAMCDAIHGVEATGTPFTTLSCDAITEFPYEESFDENGNDFPACWIQTKEQGTALWHVTGKNDGVPATAYDGDFKARFYSQFTGATTKLITPKMDLTALSEPVLQFWYTQKKWILSQDILKIYYKTSANGTWIHLVTYNENVEDWQKKHIALPNPSEDYYIAFEAVSQNGQGIQLDAMRVIDFEGFVEGAITEIVSPVSGVNYQLTTNEQVQVLIKNNGAEALTNFDLILELNGVEIATETFTNSIATLQQASFTFAATLDLSQEAEYEITVTAVITGDSNLENNTKTIVLQNVICNMVTVFPLVEGFEGALFPPLCWSAYNTGNKSWDKATDFKHSGNASAGHLFGTSAQESWLVTPQIEVAASKNLVLEFWSINQWPDDHKYSGVWISTTGNNPQTSVFTEVKQLKNSEISNSWKKIEIPLSAYAGQNIYIAFKYSGSYGDSWFVDDVTIYNFADYVDGEVVAIMNQSGEGFSANETAKVLIKNNGSDPLSNFNLKLELNGILIANETYTGSIASMNQAEYTFNTTLDLSAISTYVVNVTLEVAGDEELSNNSKTKKIANFSTESIALYGYRIFDENTEVSPLGFISFPSTDPQKITHINDFVPSAPANAIFAGEYLNGFFYAYTVGSAPVNFEKISTTTWETVATHPIEAIPSDMAYDYTTKVMYGILRVEMDSYLVTIDIETGVMTKIGASGKRLLTLACNSAGKLFTVDMSGNLYAINKTTGALSLIGTTGVSPLYVQSMAFDQNTGRLFWAMCNTNDEGQLLEIDPATGVALVRGTIAGDAEVIGLYTKIAETNQYTITLATNIEEAGIVSGGGIFEEGTEITVTATPNENYEFINWTEEGEIVSTNDSYKFIVTKNLALTANFKKKLTISNETLSSSFNIYPNPVADVLTVVRSGDEKVRIEIYNSVGAIIQSLESAGAHTCINVGTLPSGVYMIRLAGANSHGVQRFVKH